MNLRRKIYQNFGKRLLDFAITLPGMLFLLPLLFVVYFLVRTRLGTPVIFCQKRPGRDGKVFTLYKFRTMTDERNEKGELLPDAKRLTRFGRFLRSTSIDELPELINVLTGKMSLVGPRPLLVEYLPLYSSQQARRHEVLPGISGWAQINGRNALSWEQKFEYDVWYVENMSLWLDIKIIVKTLFKIFIREGVAQPGNVTMEKFTGSSEASKD